MLPVGYGTNAGPSGRLTSEPGLPSLPLTVCFLGAFRVLRKGTPVTMRSGGKAEQLLAALALAEGGVEREALMGLVWPASDSTLATQSLNTLVYWLHRTLGPAIEGRPPVLREVGRYRLNREDGVVTDIGLFDAAAAGGDFARRAGDEQVAMQSYQVAVGLYAGDLVAGSHVQYVLERERLRARYLTIRARLADHHFALGEYEASLRHALDLLTLDPCREDAHRLAMRCHVRLGERAQALRQYQLCEQVLALEFGAQPEPATVDLYEVVRLDPARA
jgi:DNA-binding SARP family transcriptional activator